MKVFLYIRVACADQLAATNQREELERYAKDKGYEVAAAVAADGISGIHTEGIMSFLLNEAKRQGIGTILTRDISRISRDVSSFMRFERKFKENGIRFEYLSKPDNELPVTPMMEAFEKTQAVHGWLSTYERLVNTQNFFSPYLTQEDLSRFGREHVETSRYLEIIYPTLGVKFVAIQERVDTETGEGTEMMPFHNIFNEWYAAQTSKKVRAVWAMKAANGKRSNFRVPYGYKRDELDKEKWLVDEAAAEVVRRIYHLCLEGKGPEQIARLLQKEKVLTPTAYYYSVGSSSANRPMPSDPYLWKDSTIDAILSNRKYTGCMVNLKTTTVSYKVHKLIRKPEEEWSIVPNAQEAIIDENTWLRVQELRKNKRRPTATGKTSLFSGLVFCADCGSKLHFCAAKSLKADQEFFRCANYKSGRGECTIHYIRNVVLEQIVSVAVSDLADFVTCHESFFLQMIEKQQSAGKDQNIQSVKSDIAAEKHRIDEIDRLIAKLYEDNFAGKLSDERYSRMAAKYEKEQAELLQSVSTKEKELVELER